MFYKDTTFDREAVALLLLSVNLGLSLLAGLCSHGLFSTQGLRQCFRCGTEGPKRPPSKNRRRPKQWSWMEATKESGGPKAMVEALTASLWYLNPDQITEDKVEAIARERGREGDQPASPTQARTLTFSNSPLCLLV